MDVLSCDGDRLSSAELFGISSYKHILFALELYMDKLSTTIDLSEISCCNTVTFTLGIFFGESRIFPVEFFRIPRLFPQDKSSDMADISSLSRLPPGRGRISSAELCSNTIVSWVGADASTDVFCATRRNDVFAILTKK
jgi:hypothetical protein